MPVVVGEPKTTGSQRAWQKYLTRQVEERVKCVTARNARHFKPYKSTPPTLPSGADSIMRPKEHKMIVEVRKDGTTLRFFYDLQEFDLSNIDALDYDRNRCVIKVFKNGQLIKSIEKVDSDVWSSVQDTLDRDFLCYPWVSFKASCITNPGAFADELKVTFTAKTYLRPLTRRVGLHQI